MALPASPPRGDPARDRALGCQGTSGPEAWGPPGGDGALSAFRGHQTSGLGATQEGREVTGPWPLGSGRQAGPSTWRGAARLPWGCRAAESHEAGSSQQGAPRTGRLSELTGRGSLDTLEGSAPSLAAEAQGARWPPATPRLPGADASKDVCLWLHLSSVRTGPTCGQRPLGPSRAGPWEGAGLRGVC